MESRASFRSAHFFCIILAQFLFFGQGAKADVKLPEGLGPVATPLTVKVNRGEELVIKLTASMKGSGGSFDFSIFEKPKNGKLVVESVTGAFALVRYISDPLSASGIEQFKYRARVRNGKYSAPATVRINVLDDPLRLKIPKILDFGEVVVSQSRTLELQMSNVSKYALNGSLILPNEFTLEGKKTDINLGPKQSATFRVKYTPKEVSGSFQRKLSFNGGGVSLSMLLRGASISPFKIRNKKIVLNYSEENSVRSADVIIENVSESEINLQPTNAKGGFVVRPKNIIIGPGEIKKVTIEASDKIHSSSSGFIGLRSQVDTQQIAVTSPPLPPRVIVNGGKNTIELSSVQGVPIKFKLPVENEGGGTVAATVILPNGFRNLDGDETIILDPKSELFFQLEYVSKDVGDIYDFIEVRWEDSIKRIIVKGDIFADQDNPKNKIKGDGTSIGKNRNDRPNEIDYPVLRRIEKERSINDLLPQIKEIELIKSGKHSLIFAWPHPEKDDRLPSEFALDYVIETRVHRYDAEKKSMLVEWIELGTDYAMVRENGPNVEAEINGLHPDGKFTFRVFSKGNDGLVSPGSIPFQFETEKSFKLTKAKWTYLMGGTGLMGLLLSICCIVIKRKRQLKA